MIRNIDILIEIQDRIHKFRILDDVIAVMLEDKDTEFSDLIETPCQEMCDILNAMSIWLCMITRRFKSAKNCSTMCKVT